MGDIIIPDANGIEFREWFKQLVSQMESFMSMNPDGFEELKEKTGFNKMKLLSDPTGFLLDLSEIRSLYSTMKE